MLLIQVLAEDVKFDTRMVGTKTVKEQFAYARLPTHKFPVRFKMNLPEHMNQAYEAGEYTFSPSNFQSGKYESLTVNPFGVLLDPVPKKAS